MVYRSRKKNKIIFYNRLRKFFFLALLPFITFLIISVIVFNLNFFKIKNYNFDVDFSVISKEQLKKLVDESLVHRYFYVYSKNNFLFYPKQEIAKKILQYSNEIESVDIFLDNSFNDLKIKITKRKPKFLECDFSGNKCAYADINNFVFKKVKKEAKEKVKKEYLIFYVDDVKIGENIFDKNKFNEILNFIKKVEATGLKVVSIKKDNKDFIYKIKILGGTKLILSRKQDLNLAGKTFMEIVKDKNLKVNKKKKSFENKIYYINLSNEKFVFYCVSDECKGNY